MSDLSLPCQRQLNLFRRQYLQLQVAIRYPDPQCLRQEIFQQSIQEELFSEDAVEHQPPQRYQIRVLKELLKKIEASITDWEEEVCLSFSTCIY
jgi:protein-lysine N-methyltransferase EEF2KMT